MARRAARRCDELAVDDQQAVIVALEEALDDHRPRVLAGDGVAAAHVLVAGEADGDAAAMVAVVGLGDDRVADPPSGAQCLRLALHQFLARHRQSQCGQDLVGLFLVARQLDGDVRRAAGDRGLDALLVLAVAELHQRLVIEPHPGDVARLRGPDQRGGRRAERAPLREADELVARHRPGPAVRHPARGTNRLGQQRAEQVQGEFAGGHALIALRVLVDDAIDARPAIDAAGLAEGDLLAGHVLQLDGDMFQHVAEPGALTLAHAAQEAARLAIGAAVLGEAGQGGAERLDEGFAEAGGGPGLKLAEVELQLDDREVRIERGADVYRAFQYAHRASLLGLGQRAGLRDPRVQVEGGAGHQHMQLQAEHAHRLPFPDAVHG